MSSFGHSDTTADAQQGVAEGRERLTQLGERRSYLGMAWRQFRRNKLAMAGLIVLVVMILIALGAGLISEYITHHGYQDQSLTSSYASIGEDGYLLGSDSLGRDTATRLAYGARISLGIAGIAIVVALTIGAAVGLTAGYYGGWIDSVLMRFVDVILSIPALFLLLFVSTLFTPGVLTLGLVIAAVAWVTLSRLVRGEVMSVKNREFVESARVIGARDRRVVLRHILPNVAPIMIVWASLTIPALILAEAALSFLQLGVQAPTPSWGNMLSNAQRDWSRSVILVLFPGLAIYITVFSINLMANGLRDALDPRITD